MKAATTQGKRARTYNRKGLARAHPCTSLRGTASAGPGAGCAGAAARKEAGRTGADRNTRHVAAAQRPPIAVGHPARRRPAGFSPGKTGDGAPKEAAMVRHGAVILLAVMLAFAIRPGGAAVAGAMLFVYFRWWWKR